MSCVSVDGHYLFLNSPKSNFLLNYTIPFHFFFFYKYFQVAFSLKNFQFFKRHRGPQCKIAKILDISFLDVYNLNTIRYLNRDSNTRFPPERGPHDNDFKRTDNN